MISAVSLAVAHVSVAAQSFLADGGSTPSDVDPSTGKGPEWGEAAPIGLLVLVLMGVACYFLARSFSKNMKRVPKSFDPVEAAEADGAEVVEVGSTVDAASATSKTSGSPAGSSRRSPKT